MKLDLGELVYLSALIFRDLYLAGTFGPTSQKVIAKFKNKFIDALQGTFPGEFRDRPEYIDSLYFHLLDSLNLDLGTPVTLVTERFAPVRGDTFSISVFCLALCDLGRWPVIRDALRGPL